MGIIEAVIPRRRRRRWLWYASTAFQKDVHVTFDGDLDLWSPVTNFTARQTFVAGYRDPAAFSWMDRYLRPGMTVFDVGANVGVYGMFMARKVAPKGTCYAFEPNPELKPYLEANKRVNGLVNLDLSFVGTGESPSEVGFVTNRSNIGESHVDPASATRAGRSDVQIVRLDDFVAERGIGPIDFVKIDVEGFELPTLRGFENTLRRKDEMIVHTEIEPRHMKRYGYTLTDLFQFMHALGYSAFALDHNGFSPYDASTKAKDAYWSRSALCAG